MFCQKAVMNLRDMESFVNMFIHVLIKIIIARGILVIIKKCIVFAQAHLSMANSKEKNRSMIRSSLHSVVV